MRLIRLLALALLVATCSDGTGTPDGGMGGTGGNANGGRGGGGVGGSGGMNVAGTGGGVSGRDGGLAGNAAGIAGNGGGMAGNDAGMAGNDAGMAGNDAGMAGNAGGSGGLDGGVSCGGHGGWSPAECPFCPTTLTVADLVEACIVAEDGAPLKMSVDGEVTVVSADDVPGGNCQRVDRTTSGDTTKRLVLQPATGPRWTVYLRVPDLPAAIVSANDTLRLTVWASGGGFLTPGEAEQTIALSRAGQLVAFAVAGGSVFPSVALASVGIQVSDAGAVCHVQRCANVPHATHVAVGNAQATFNQGQTMRVGNVSFTVEEHSRWFANGGCDGKDVTRMGGYVVP